jgi:hypothetical protein
VQPDLGIVVAYTESSADFIVGKTAKRTEHEDSAKIVRKLSDLAADALVHFPVGEQLFGGRLAVDIGRAECRGTGVIVRWTGKRHRQLGFLRRPAA